MPQIPATQKPVHPVGVDTYETLTTTDAVSEKSESETTKKEGK